MVTPALVCWPWLRALRGGLVAGRVGAEVSLGHGFLHDLVVHILVHAVRSHCTPYLIREAFELKNVTKSGKSPPGGGVRKKHQKVQNSKFGLFDKREAIFSFFSQIQMHTLDTSVEEKIS